MSQANVFWSEQIMERQLRAFLPLVIAGLVALGGCGGRAGTAEVKGRVIFKDGSVPRGAVCVVRFQPATDSTAEIRKAATGEIEADGHFEAFTRKPGDGVFVGKYDVTFSVLEDGTRSDSSLIDEKFTRASTTPYHVTIEDDVSDLEFQLEPPTNGKK
jgi:hypothetical protein